MPILPFASACSASEARPCGGWGAEPGRIARALVDPGILSRTLRTRAVEEIEAERLDAADALAGEALHWATVAGDDWQIAEASRGKAIAASNIVDLRERVEEAASLLSEVGNIHDLANLLTDAAFASLCLGSDRDAR